MALGIIQTIMLQNISSIIQLEHPGPFSELLLQLSSSNNHYHLIAISTPC